MKPGLNIVLTGATRGLGRALTAGFVAAGHRVFGCGRDVMTGSDFPTLLPAQERDRWSGIPATLRNDASSFRLDRLDILKENGEPLIVSVHGGRIRVRGEDVFYCSFTDITEQVRLDDAWQLSLEKLLQSEKMAFLGTIVSGFAHDINNPAQIITENSSIVGEVWNDARLLIEDFYRQNRSLQLAGMPYEILREEIPLAIEHVKDAARRISRMVRDLLDYAREEKPSFEEDVDMNRVTEHAVQLMRRRISQSTHRFETSFWQGLPAFRGNGQQLEQVVVNLVQNALDALPGPERGVYVSTEYAESENRILLRVRDEGEGMPPEIIEKVQTPFFSTKRKSGGTGLGLAMSTMLVESHGGRLEIKSAPGAGTTVTVSIPAGGVDSQS